MKSNPTLLLLLSACFVLGAAGERFRCEPATLARWFSYGRAWRCHYRCAWSIRNYAMEEDGTPCIIKYNSHGVCHQGYCVKFSTPKPAPPVTKKPNSGSSGTTNMVTRALEVSTTRAQTRDGIKSGDQFTSTWAPDVTQHSKHASTQRGAVTVTRPYTTTGLPETETTSREHFTTTQVPDVTQHSKHGSTQRGTVTVTRLYTTTGLPETETTSREHFTTNPLPDVTQHSKHGSTQRGTVTLTRPYTTTGLPETETTSREHFTTNPVPDVTQHSKHGSTQRGTVTVTRPYTTTGLPETETTSTEHFTSTRAFTTQETTTSNTHEGDAIRTYPDDDNSNKQARTTRYEVRPTDQEVQTTRVGERPTTTKYDDEDNRDFEF